MPSPHLSVCRISSAGTKRTTANSTASSLRRLDHLSDVNQQFLAARPLPRDCCPPDPPDKCLRCAPEALDGGVREAVAPS
eukprot:15462042-Alexandrium_andersonii.AAC.1